MEIKKNGKTIVLNMIVKNESKIIERCIKSVYDIIDTWCIVDTGSTDGTQEIIKELLKDKPGKLIEKPWINFGHNRNEALGFAREWGDWILLTDADMVLVNQGFDKNTLDERVDAYDVIQVNHGTSYYNFRLLNTRKEWRCIGVTHEYYDCEGGVQVRQRMPTLWFDDISDGGSKDDKFERDIRLLTQGLIDEPGNARYMFYLAQSYRDTAQWDLAIEWYAKRANEGGWDEEVWYSEYMVGWCQVNRGDSWHDFMPQLMKCWAMRPRRIEPMWMLGIEARKRKMLTEAYQFSKIAAQAPYPDEDLLFVLNMAYDFGSLDEHIICSCLTANWQDAEGAALYLLENKWKMLPDAIKPRVKGNLWLAQKNQGKFNEEALFNFIKHRKSEI